MKRSAASRLATMEKRANRASAIVPLTQRLNSWQVQGVLAELAAMAKGEPKVDWPKLPPDLPPWERPEALIIVTRWDEELARFPQEHPDQWEVICSRRRGEVHPCDRSAAEV